MGRSRSSTAADRSRSVERSRARCLPLLLLARGRAVSTERLIEEIWDGRRPDTAHKIVQLHSPRFARRSERSASRRSSAATCFTSSRGSSTSSGSRSSPTPLGAPPGEALQQLRAAFELVRGGPLDDLRLESWAPGGRAARGAGALGNRGSIEAELAVGRHREVVRELERLVAAHPDREDLLRLLMLALYRCGRQTEALDAYRRTSSRLRAELGWSPARRCDGSSARSSSTIRRSISPSPPALRRAPARHRDGRAGRYSRRALRWSPQLP